MVLADEKKRDTYHHGDLRTALVDAAEAELIASGLQGFSLRKVAVRVGVSHSACSHHFGNTQGLLAALGVRAFGQVLAAMQSRSAGLVSPAERVVASGLGYIDFARANPSMFRLIFGSQMICEGSDDLDRAGMAAFDYFAQAIQQLADTPAVEDAAFEEQVYTAWTVTHGFAEMILTGRLACLTDDDSSRVERMYRKALRALL